MPASSTSVSSRSLSPRSARADNALLGFLRSNPVVDSEVDPHALFDLAERHGVAGVVLDAWRARGLSLPPDLARRLDVHALARELDHSAHRALLATIDDRFARAGLVGVALKGPMFGERYYARPSARATTDIDLLVEPGTLDLASKELGELGYVGASGREEERVRREHHHLHFSRPGAPPLELHFHAYTGFGRILASPPLLERSRPVAGLRAIGVLAPEDELVFLAVHAAVHRFVRLGWLYDLVLLTATMSDDELVTAAERAKSWGFGRALTFTSALLVDRLGAPERLRELLGGGRQGSWVARRVVAEPANAVLRSATRMVYTVSLCDRSRSAASYLLRASTGHVRRLLQLPP